MGSDGKVVAVIEAKKLGDDLEKHRGQLVRYAYESSPAYAVLSNGDDWELYSIKASENEFHLHLVVTCTLSETDPLQSARKLLDLWQANVSDGQPIEAETPILGLPEVRAEPQPIWPLIAETMDPSLTPGEDWLPLPSLHEMDKTRHKPRQVRFQEDPPVDLVKRAWSQLHFEAMQWLADKGGLDSIYLPFTTENGHTLANQTNKRANGSDMIRPNKLRNKTIYVDLNFSANDLIKRTLDAFGLLGQDPYQVRVRLS